MNSIKLFKIIAGLEGLSLIALLFISMPLKYMMEIPEPNKVIGMAHGILFVIYTLMIPMVAKAKAWNMKTQVIVFIASFVPFMTFLVVDRKLKE